MHYGLSPQSMGPAGHIFDPRLWQGTMGPDATLEAWSIILEKWNELFKHWTIAASAGSYFALRELIICFQEGSVTRESIDSTLASYNSSCAEMRSEARDSSIRAIAETI